MRRALALALGGTLLLAGCGGDRAVPKIKVHRGSFTASITPSTYCFAAKDCTSSKKIDLPVVPARVKDQVEVDVPRAVVDRGWAVAAISLDSARALGGSGAIRKTRTYRFPADVNDGAPFIVEVTQLRKGKPDGSKWSFLVKVTGKP